MKDKRLVSRLIFVLYLVSALLLPTTALALQHIGELRYERTQLQETLRGLIGVEEENTELVEQLQEVQLHIEQVEQRNQVLEEMLLNKVQTWLIVTEGIPVRAEVAQLSRSGRQQAMVTGLSMPVLSLSSFTAADYERAWQRLGLPNMAGIGESLAEAEARFGVNSLVLAAIAWLESAGGTSKIARNKNNFLGLGAYDGSAYQLAFVFDTSGESIMFAAELLRFNYLTPGGRYHNGPDLRGIGIRYATDPRWAVKVAIRMELIARAAIEDPDALLLAAATAAATAAIEEEIQEWST